MEFLTKTARFRVRVKSHHPPLPMVAAGCPEEDLCNRSLWSRLVVTYVLGRTCGMLKTAPFGHGSLLRKKVFATAPDGRGWLLPKKISATAPDGRGWLLWKKIFATALYGRGSLWDAENRSLRSRHGMR